MSKRLSAHMMAALLMIFPTAWVRPIANMFGHRIASGAKIGFSFVLARRIYLARSARIGHLDIIKVDRIFLGRGARVGTMNYCSGPFSIRLRSRAAVGNRNVITRAPKNVSIGYSTFRLGCDSKVTAGHKLDCAASIVFGEHSILAGVGSQIWTHGYVHQAMGPSRYRIDGAVTVGDHVYVGSRAMITGGVSLVDTVIVGAGVTVARSLSEPGFYVSAATRQLPLPIDPHHRSDLLQVSAQNHIETVYRKVDAPS